MYPNFHKTVACNFLKTFNAYLKYGNELEVGI